MDSKVNIKEFSLGTVISAISGNFCVDNFKDVLDLSHFVFEDDNFGILSLFLMREELRNHLLILYPELADLMPPIKTDKNSDHYFIERDCWVKEQQEIFGENLLICPLGKKISNFTKTRNIGENNKKERR